MPSETACCEITDQQRLAALESYAILDTPPEKDFDDIAQLAADICGTPIAVVNLVGDHRQFFKAEVGLGVRETPFDSSFCAKAILEEDFLLVPDATRDHRFEHNPLVTGEPHLRFYAGALLKSEAGPIGTICVLDYQPRELNELQQRTLVILARQVMTQLELRRSFRIEAERLLRENENIRQEEEKRLSAQRAGRVGTFEIDIASDTIEMSEQACEVFGLPICKTYPASVLETIIIEEDKNIASTPESRRGGTAKLDVDYRVRRPKDNILRWISRRGRFITDSEGNILKLAGIVIDVTEAKQKEVHSAALLSLGDELHDMNSIPEATRITAETLGRGLKAMRAGYSIIDRNENAFIVETDWTESDAISVKGRHDLKQFTATVEKLASGETLSVPNVETASWLGKDIAAYASIGVRSFIKVPILDHGRLVGSLFAHDASPRFWTKDEMDFAWGVADRTYAAIAKIKAEAEQVLLNNELSHRLKNTLAMVQAIATQTLKDVTEREAVAAFSNRLLALGTAHDILLRQDRSSANLVALVTKVVTLHAPETRLEIAGPALAIGPKAGLSLSLLLHELATNAIKHGALSNDTGTISVSWQLDRGKQEPVFILRWEERGGPKISEPKSRSFGSRLIRMGLCGTGDVEKRFDESGLIAVFKAPLVLMEQVSD